MDTAAPHAINGLVMVYQRPPNIYAMAVIVNPELNLYILQIILFYHHQMIKFAAAMEFV
jgi:hypothetical protein